MTHSARPLRIGLLEDQPLFREMLQHLLSSVSGFTVQQASSVRQALNEWDATELDVALLDFELPDGTGLEAGRALRKAHPELGIVLLSAVNRSLIMLELEPHEVGRWSYLSKQASLSASTLVRAIRASADGRVVIDPAVVQERKARTGSKVAALSTRQREVLGLLAEGFTNQAIAEHLGLSVNSINNHVNALYVALGLNESTRNPRVTAVRVFLEETA